MDREVIGNISVWKNFDKIEIEREKVFKAMKVFPGSPSYTEISEDFDKVLEKLVPKMNPMAATVIGNRVLYSKGEVSSKGNQVLYCMLTLGGLVSEESDFYFAKGEYVKGLLCDSITDCALFEYVEILQKEICLFLRERGYGVRGRIEPDEDTISRLNNETHEALNAWNTLGVQITRSFMYSPVKTISIIYSLSKDVNEMRLDYDCAECGSLNCSWRK
ncbi:MAG: hypothetical protein J6P05_00880 [Lachnospiraceae bacterium]|nr:hypothetical protein [Lachnospiraceae bacterium]